MASTKGLPENHDSDPILSICIPTFNRAKYLDNLLRNLSEIKRQHANAIEIHVSDNSSTDNTQAIIGKWADALSLKVVVQPENIGGTRNIVEVTRNARSRWAITIGDDDVFIPENLTKLLDVLRSSDPREWILVGIANKQGNEYLLGNLSSGQYSPRMLRWVFLKRGISCFGFIGMHVIPTHSLPNYWKLLSEPIEGWNSWPHLALFLRHVMHNGRTRILRLPVVISSPNEDSAFFQIGDWVCVTLRKLNVILEIKTTKLSLRLYRRLHILREVLNVLIIKDILFWRIVDPADFYQRANTEVRLTLGKHLRSFSPCFIYIIAIKMFSLVPHKLLRMALTITRRSESILNYEARRTQFHGVDGTSRGQ